MDLLGYLEKTLEQEMPDHAEVYKQIIVNAESERQKVLEAKAMATATKMFEAFEKVDEPPTETIKMFAKLPRYPKTLTQNIETAANFVESSWRTRWAEKATIFQASKSKSLMNRFDALKKKVKTIAAEIENPERSSAAQIQETFTEELGKYVGSSLKLPEPATVRDIISFFKTLWNLENQKHAEEYKKIITVAENKRNEFWKGKLELIADAISQDEIVPPTDIIDGIENLLPDEEPKYNLESATALFTQNMIKETSFTQQSIVESSEAALRKRSEKLTEKLKTIAADMKNPEISSAQIQDTVNAQLEGYVELEEKTPVKDIITKLKKLLQYEDQSGGNEFKNIIREATDIRNQSFQDKSNIILAEIGDDKKSPADILVNIINELPRYAVTTDSTYYRIEKATNAFQQIMIQETTFTERSIEKNLQSALSQRSEKLTEKLQIIAAEIENDKKSPVDVLVNIKNQLPGYVVKYFKDTPTISDAIELIIVFLPFEEKEIADKHVPLLKKALETRFKTLEAGLKLIATVLKDPKMSAAQIRGTITTELGRYMVQGTGTLMNDITKLKELLHLEGPSNGLECRNIIKTAENKRNSLIAGKLGLIATEIQKDQIIPPTEILKNINERLPGYLGSGINDIETATTRLTRTVNQETTHSPGIRMPNLGQALTERLRKLKGKLEVIEAELQKIDKTPVQTMVNIKKQLPGYANIGSDANIRRAIELIQAALLNEQKIIADKWTQSFQTALNTRSAALKALFDIFGNLIKTLNESPQNVNDKINGRWNRYSSPITFNNLSDTITAVVAALEKEDVAAKRECETKISVAENNRRTQLELKLSQLCQKIGEPAMTPGELKTKIPSIFQDTYIAVPKDGNTLIKIRHNVEAQISQDLTAVVTFAHKMACGAFKFREKSVNGGLFFAWDGLTFVAALTKDNPVEYGPANAYVKKAASGEWVNMEQHPAVNLPAVLPPFLRYSLKYGAPQGDTKVSEIIQSPVNGT
eukprot:GHVT01037239.1.p1 GENE.GHVT01037239.1~~GHVT01037239.1.p1  ORF type:complete len:1045 (+),score=109.91 GHVT01037239.1:163-3135(+)